MDEIFTYPMLLDAEEAGMDRVKCAESREDEENAWSHLRTVRDAQLGEPISDELRETLEVLGVID